MFSDEDIRRMASAPSKVSEESYQQRALKIVGKVIDVQRFATEFKSTFEELACRYYPAPTVAESVAIAMKKLKEDLASEDAPMKSKRHRWVIS
jgi:hypothetical protein